MGKSILIAICVAAAFVLEFFLFNMLGRWLTPNLELLLIIFFNLYFGIRYGLVTAVLAGVLKDSFSPAAFGIYTSSFMVCAYMTTLLKQYIYHMGSRLSRSILILSIVIINVIVHSILYSARVGAIDGGEVVRYVFLPQAVVTLLAAPFLFTQLKRCASRLFA